MPGFSPRLHGMVGRITGLTAAAPAAVAPAPADNLKTAVFISGTGATDDIATGLDEDVRLLVEAFVLRARSGAGQAKAGAPASQAQGDLHIALHGLNLSAEQTNELRQLISELVAKRVAGGGATP